MLFFELYIQSGSFHNFRGEVLLSMIFLKQEVRTILQVGHNFSIVENVSKFLRAKELEFP